MISKQEVNDFATTLALRPDVVEKDYALGWILAGITAHPELASSWIFKGGTALKKCFFETYRFSEDLDFSLTTAEHLSEPFLRRVFSDVGVWVYDQCGMEVPTETLSFKVQGGGAYVEGKAGYIGPLGRRAANPKVKLDLIADELIALPSEVRSVHHPYSDLPATGMQARCYSFAEIFAEKVRALAERCRPRDLYDVIHLYRARTPQTDQRLVQTTLERKCAHKQLPVPTAEAILTHRYREELGAQWSQMLRHQLTILPPIDAFLAELPNFFQWLSGSALVSEPPTLASKAEEVIWQPPPRRMGHAPSALERLRMAAANRLCVYLTFNGKVRTVEPYSFRVKGGTQLFYGFDRGVGEIRGYTISKIQGVEVSDIPYTPRYRVEIG